MAEKHPQRYPRHLTDKGQVLAGACNTTRCTNDAATWFNNQTYGYYCRVCARGQNHFERENPICVEVDHQLTIAEMDALYRAHLEARYGKRAS